MLFLDAAAVRAALSMEDAIGLMAEAMRRYSDGRVTQPLRTILRPESDDGVFAAMPCHVDGEGYGIKAIALRPGNHARGLPTHVGVLVVFDPDTGFPLAVLDAAALTAVRTAAVSAVATDTLAGPDAGDLAILGAGVQARSHLEAMSVVRKLRRVRVWSRTLQRAQEYRVWAASTLDIDVEVVLSAGAALEGADLVCTTTSAKEPVVEAGHLAEGAHVNAVGASTRDARELHADAVARCSVFVDSRESARGESADLGVPHDLGLIPDDFPELGEVLLGRRAGRADSREITLYKSLGLAAQDVVAGFAAARAATARGIGVSVPYEV